MYFIQWNWYMPFLRPPLTSIFLSINHIFNGLGIGNVFCEKFLFWGAFAQWQCAGQLQAEWHSAQLKMNTEGVTLIRNAPPVVEIHVLRREQCYRGLHWECLHLSYFCGKHPSWQNKTEQLQYHEGPPSPICSLESALLLHQETPALTWRDLRKPFG